MGKIERKKIITERIVIENIYGDKELYKDLRNLRKMWGDKFWNTVNSSFGICLDKRPTSNRIAYLPDYTRKLYRRHLIMNLNFLSSMVKNGRKEELENWLNWKFGEKNWFYGKYNEIKILLIKNLLEKPYSTKKNKWSCKLSKDRSKIIITKIEDEESNIKDAFYVSDEDLGKGFYYKKNG